MKTIYFCSVSSGKFLFSNDLLIIVMKRVFLNTFASLLSKRSESSLDNAIDGLFEEHNAPFWYSRIRHGIRSFFVENLNYAKLDELLIKLDEFTPESHFQKYDCANSIQVVQLIKEKSFGILGGKDMLKPEVKTVPFYGIELDVNPDAIIVWKDQDGRFHVGAIKTKLRKSAFRAEEATVIACMLKYYLTSLFPEYIIEDEYCICYDAFRSKFYSVNNYTQNLIKASKIAERIAARTPKAA